MRSIALIVLVALIMALLTYLIVTATADLSLRLKDQTTTTIPEGNLYR